MVLPRLCRPLIKVYLPQQLAASRGRMLPSAVSFSSLIDWQFCAQGQAVVEADDHHPFVRDTTQ
jgi:hypothetical protein